MQKEDKSTKKSRVDIGRFDYSPSLYFGNTYLAVTKNMHFCGNQWKVVKREVGSTILNTKDRTVLSLFSFRNKYTDVN